MKNTYVLGFPPYTTFPHLGVWDNRQDAKKAFDIWKHHPEYKGRGLKIYKCDQQGNIL